MWLTDWFIEFVTQTLKSKTLSLQHLYLKPKHSEKETHKQKVYFRSCSLKTQRKASFSFKIPEYRGLLNFLVLLCLDNKLCIVLYIGVPCYDFFVSVETFPPHKRKLYMKYFQIEVHDFFVATAFNQRNIYQSRFPILHKGWFYYTVIESENCVLPSSYVFEQMFVVVLFGCLINGIFGFLLYIFF